MSACPALAFEVPTRDMLVLRNGFNDETFIFPNRLDNPHAIYNDVVLGEGGSGGGDGLEHVHPLADETFFVRSGRLKVVVHGVSHFVNPRESLRIRRGVPHYFANAHGGDTEFSVVFDPPQQHRRFLEQNAFKRKRLFTLPLCFDASLRVLPIPSNRKTLSPILLLPWSVMQVGSPSTASPARC
jgi:hypothetical protein